ncbi:branched-chain amino acid ABC transporter substrate-binding protein [Paracoccus aestuarii]|uniref:Branched-chain amino acid ABC transporter substrate-binding protein n=1 Tax=Paracoccus aestuarii TaxID=453842 RepID=A0A418ZYH6_9RHOB|nr:ABC transporter substrate-binding protein [Paracoccus aestuarii]RJL05517.1 branched-chain amino acid ABC transporter substrate-binding protein [Paracoccus aestuarii]WCQ98616.1 ABC transporter substrate-binding protein [Paracoccus aestuarii]
MLKSTTAFVLGLGLASAALGQSYDTGASDDEIKFGVILPLSGPASAYGSAGACFEGYFNRVNDNGGINGRKVSVIVRDDGYNPARTLEQARRLVERDGVLFIAGNIGTPGNSAIHSYMNQRKVPHIFLITGASKWDDPENYPWTMAFTPSYAAEALIYAQYIKENFPQGKVGILYQNDDFGRDYLEPFLQELGEDMVVSQVSFDTTAATVDSQMSALKDSGADIFFNVASPKFAAQAIRRAGEIGWAPTQFLVSVSNAKSAVLEPAGLAFSDGIITTQYLKEPSSPAYAEDADVAAWHDFRDNYFRAGSEGNWWDWSCYSASFAIEHVLNEAGDDLTRTNLMAVASGLKDLETPMLLDGITLTTGPDDFAPIEAMSLMRFNGDSWELFGDVMNVD